MKTIKRFVCIALFALICATLCSCQESDSAKLSRLEREAAKARQEAQKAKDDYDNLNNFLNKYGK